MLVYGVLRAVNHDLINFINAVNRTPGIERPRRSWHCLGIEVTQARRNKIWFMMSFVMHLWNCNKFFLIPDVRFYFFQANIIICNQQIVLQFQERCQWQKSETWRRLSTEWQTLVGRAIDVSEDRLCWNQRCFRSFNWRRAAPWHRAWGIKPSRVGIPALLRRLLFEVRLRIPWNGTNIRFPRVMKWYPCRNYFEIRNSTCV